MSVPACPHCRRTPAPGTAVPAHCPGCGTDLMALRALVDLADRHWNRALTAARDGRWADAAESLAVTLALAPEDVEAIVLLARVRRRQGRLQDAVALAERAETLAPGRNDLDDVRAPLPDGEPPARDAQPGPDRRTPGQRKGKGSRRTRRARRG